VAEEADGPKLRVYRSARCKIERPLLDKLVKAVAALEQRLHDVHGEAPAAGYATHRAAAEKALAAGDLPAAFREDCRAMHVLLKTMNQQRHREETFQPVWDKHVSD
jgi:hypothetical protein